MTLLVSTFAAIVCTVIWYTNEKRDSLKLGFLSLMFWGASLMWFVDAIFEYAELKAEYFTPAAEDMLNDFFLGLSVVALGLVIWLIVLMIKDPKGVVKATILKK
jgi:multisubunit Na+/H+ antiporter MnhB subunit